MPQRRLTIFWLVAGMAGCAFVKIPAQPPIATVQRAQKDILEQRPAMPLAPPMGPARRVVQQLTALWPDRQESLLCVLELDFQRISMAAVTPDGLSLFNLTYDGHDLNLDKNPMLPDSVAPEFIMADVQLVFWPVTALQKILLKPWRLEADGSQRRLYYGNDRRVDVHYLTQGEGWPQTVELVNHSYHYRLRIQTISYEIVSE